ncbi:MAG TPA: ABC transporter permease, partial [Vicinamibacterales bacterium]|nr:ABC transporter permease [Vicinamibacterales bacterium]
MDSLMRDLRHGLRRVVAAPGFAAIAVLTLALGIGANVAIFTVVNAVLIRPLPFPNPDRLVRIAADARATNGRNIGISQPELDDLSNRAGVFEGVTAVWPVSASMLGGERPERVEVLATSANYFQLLGASAEIGRVYGPGDAVPGFSEAVVISDGLWRRAFGAAPDIVGRKVVMDTDPYTVVGVMPRNFRHPGETVRGDVDVWSACGFAAAPFSSPPQRQQNFIPGVMGRLKPGISLEQGQDRLDALSAELRAAYPTNYPANTQWALRLDGVQSELTNRIRPTLSVLMGAVVLLLVLACVNVANLTLARASSRVREIAVRRALGATRARLVCQLLVESVVVAIAGGAAALAALAWSKDWIVRMMPTDLPRLTEVRFDGGMVATSLVLSIVAGVAFGIVPAIQVSGVNPGDNLKEAGRGLGEGRRERRFRSGLVAAEIAISLVLLVGAGLLVRSFWSMLQVNPGLDPSRVGFAQIWIPVPNDPTKNPYSTPAQRNAYINEVLRRVGELPGIESVAMSTSNRTPFSGSGVTQRFTFVGESTAPADVRRAQFQIASPDYFATLKSPVLSGRAFTTADTAGSEPVVIVNETLAKTQSPGKDVVGRSIAVGRQSARIVGVVADIHDDGLDVPVASRVYFPLLQRSNNALTVFYRSTTDPASLNTEVERAIHAVDSTLPVFGQRTMEDLLADSMTRRKVVLSLMGAFGVVALLLAAIGTYGVMSVAANQRVREIGIRMALGAQRRDIERLIVRPGLVLAVAGVAAGVATAALLARLMSAVLFAVASTDVMTYAAVSLLLIAVTLMACYVPARRATKQDP